jgi:dethiobiotin synthetase
MPSSALAITTVDIEVLLCCAAKLGPINQAMARGRS